MELGGLHHLTAVTGNAAGNVHFYTQVLGMRLVKKTVNQDDVSAYHLFYGDEVGNPGTEVTFFDWPNIGRNRPGTGMIAAMGLRVSDRKALEWWSHRLDQHGIPHEGIQDRGDRAMLAFDDPEGQRLQLVEDGGKPGGSPWKESPVPPEVAIRGLDSVSLCVQAIGPTERTLTEVLGFRRAGSYSSRDVGFGEAVVFETGPGGAGAEVHLMVRPDVGPGRLGIGGVHHAAFRTPTEEEHRQWRDHIAQGGLGVTPVIDRFYFRSIYFREPGGVLFEVATDGPGFATDEPQEHLGESLALPPFLEPYRRRIEAGLKPISVPSSGRKAA